MLKKLFCLFLILTTALSTGCSVSENQIKREMMKYLEKKYDEKFIELSFSRPNFLTMPYYSMTVSPENNEDIVFGVRRTRDGDFMFDTYVINLLKPELKKTAEDIIKKYFSDYKLSLSFDGSYNDNTLPDEYGKDTTIDDLIELCKTRTSTLTFRIIVYLEHGHVDSAEIQKCMDELTAKCVNPYLSFYTVFPEYYEKIAKNISEWGFDKSEADWYDEYFKQSFSSENKDELVKLIERVKDYD